MNQANLSGSDSDSGDFVEDILRQPSRARFLRDLPDAKARPWTADMLRQMGVEVPPLPTS